MATESKLRLYIDDQRNSTWLLRAWLCLKRVGLPFEEARVPLFNAKGVRLLRDVLGAETVPVLLDGELCIRDSLVIVEYLAEQYPELWPSSRCGRAHVRLLCVKMHSGFNAIRGEVPMDVGREPAVIGWSAQCGKEVARIESCWLSAISRQADSGAWLCGEWSIADAFFAPVAVRSYGCAVPVSAPAQRYIEAHLSPPLVREWDNATARINASVEATFR